MTPRKGIHAHPNLKLGLRPPKNAPALRAADFFDAAAVPAHDPADDNLGSLPFGLYKNDTYGDCGPVSVANNVIQVTAGKTVPKLDDVFDLYRRSGNPSFDPATGAGDDGVDMQTMLEALLAGGIGGRKPIAFAKIDAADQQLLEAAIYVFDGVLFGVDLQTAQQAQSDAKTPVWEYATPHSDWGGHAILSGRYVDSTGRVAVISWKTLIDTTKAFRENQLGEVWVVVWPEHLTRPGVDVAKLAAAFKALTGKTLPVPVPPKPAPAPSPPAPPAPVPSTTDDDAALWAALRPWAVAKHTLTNKKAATTVKAWAKKKGYA